MSIPVLTTGAWREFPLNELIELGILVPYVFTKEELDAAAKSLADRIDAMILKRLINGDVGCE